MKANIFLMLVAFSIISPQFWSRIGLPSNLQVTFAGASVTYYLFNWTIAIPNGKSSRCLLYGITLICFAPLLSVFNLIEISDFLIELIRRIIIFLFFLICYSFFHARPAQITRFARKTASGITFLYLFLYLLHKFNIPLLNEVPHESYPFGFLLPVAVYNNPVIFSETQIFCYFLIAILMLSKLNETLPSKKGRLIRFGGWFIAFIQFSKGPLFAVLVSIFSRKIRPLFFLYGLMPIFLIYMLYIYSGTMPAFDGNFGSINERLFHFKSALFGLANNGSFGLIGYGYRQYGTFISAHNGFFNSETQPLSLIQIVFESGLVFGTLAIIFLFKALVMGNTGSLRKTGTFLFFGMLFLPNPFDVSVLLILAIFAAACAQKTLQEKLKQQLNWDGNNAAY